MKQSKPWTIGQLAKQANVGVETVRYYQRRGLMPVPTVPGGVRRYDDSALRRLRFIKRAQSLGFSLDDIVELLSLGTDACAETVTLARRKRDMLAAKREEIDRMLAAIDDLLAQCESPHDDACPMLRFLDKP